MNTHWRLPLCASVVLACAGGAQAQQQFESQSLLPIPAASDQVLAYPSTGVPSYNLATRQVPESDLPAPSGQEEHVPSPSDMPVPRRMPQHGPHLYGSGDSPAYADPQWDAGCASDLPSAFDGCGPVWFGGVYGIYMTRDDENPFWLSTDDFATGGSGAGVLNSRDASMDYEPGAEVRFGRYFQQGSWAWEAVYWTIFSETNEANAFDADTTGDLITPLSVNNLNIGIDNVTEWFDDAVRHRLRRSHEIHNVEVNLLRFPFAGGCGDGASGTGACAYDGGYGAGYGAGYGGGCGSYQNCGLSVAGIFGVRFLRIDEGFLFSADDTNTTFGDTLTDELHYHIDTENNLIGAQIGCLARYNYHKWSLFGDVKLGIYGNHITHQQSLFDGAGTVATINNGPYNGNDFWFDTNKNDVSFIGELRLGGSYRFHHNWSLVGAYRAVALTGVALPTNQIPANFGDFGGVANIDSNGSMILHGAQFGVECNF